MENSGPYLGTACTLHRGIVFDEFFDRSTMGTVMNALGQKRRFLLLNMWGLSASQGFVQTIVSGQAAVRQGYVLGGDEGEHLVHFRDQGKIVIKAGSATDSGNLALAVCGKTRSEIGSQNIPK